MWSDASVEAAHAVLRGAGVYAGWDVLARALHAAEAAAWSTDMDACPTFERVFVAGWQPPCGQVRGYWWCHETETDETGAPMDHSGATAWRPLPQPPAETGGEE